MPVRDEARAKQIGVVAFDDVAASREAGDGFGDASGAPVDERAAFVGVALSPVLFEMDGVLAACEVSEGAAGFDLGQLAVVADEHDFGAASRRLVGEFVEGPGADHAGFVDHEDAVLRQAVVFEERLHGRHGEGRYAGAGFELRGRPGRERAANDVVAARGPRVAGGVERKGFAGASSADNHVDRGARRRDRGDHRSLFVGQARPRRDRRVDRVLVGDSDVAFASAFNTTQQPVFGVQADPGWSNVARPGRPARAQRRCAATGSGRRVPQARQRASPSTTTSPAPRTT